MAPNDNLNIDKKHFKIKNKILIEPDMFYSLAFKILSASAIRTLMRCLQKRKWNRVKRNGRKQIEYTDDGFIFPYAEADFLGIATTQFWKNIKKLVEVGFLDIVHQGGWFQKDEKQKDYSIYKFSDRWKLYGTENFRSVEKKKVLQHEYYVRENLKRQKTRTTSQKGSDLLHKDEVGRATQDNNRLHNSEDGGKQPEPAARLGNTI